MTRPLAKKTAKRLASIKSDTAPAGRILEMRPARQRGYPPFALILLFVAVAGITAAVLSFQKMSVAVAYADRAGAQLSDAKILASDLRTKVADLETLQTLAAKKQEPLAISPDQTWLEYSSKNIALQYPSGFTLQKATSAFPALTISGPEGKIEIFRMADFGGKRPVGSGNDVLPKESLLVGTAPEDSRIQPYDAWLYYDAGDDAAKAELEAIAASVKALK